jgi:hypothetical protein
VSNEHGRKGVHVSYDWWECIGDFEFL